MAKSIKQIVDEEAAAAEVTKDDLDVQIPAHVKVTRGGPRTRVLQVRLNDDELAALEALADARNLPASTVVREMILNTLNPAPAQAAARQRLVGEFEHYLDVVGVPSDVALPPGRTAAPLRAARASDDVQSHHIDSLRAALAATEAPRRRLRKATRRRGK